ncbi:MAG TPA: DUF971 domain-containing protein [Caulobacteraceae bacterium]|jgi:DUF971 family protein
MEKPWPIEFRLNKAGDQLSVAFDDGEVFHLPSEYLRVMTGSAEDRGHGAGPRPPIPGKKHVRITAIHPVGRYAVRLVFDDGHDTGLYSWDLLRDLGAERDRFWFEYMDTLEKAGLSRA